jgi:nucleotidyltransferase/DNA polymerase involved in DNA repair
MAMGTMWSTQRPSIPKSIGHSETFPYDTSDEGEILQSSMSSLWRRLKAPRLLIRRRERRSSSSSKTKTSKPTINPSLSKRRPRMGNDFERAKSLYEANFLGIEIRLVGVTLQNLVDPKKETVQMTFDNYESSTRRWTRRNSW